MAFWTGDCPAGSSPPLQRRKHRRQRPGDRAAGLLQKHRRDRDQHYRSSERFLRMGIASARFGSTSLCACLISRPISASVRPAATTRTRDFRRAKASPSTGPMMIETGSFAPMPRRSNSAVTSAAVVSMTSEPGIHFSPAWLLRRGARPRPPGHERSRRDRHAPAGRVPNGLAPNHAACRSGCDSAWNSSWVRPRRRIVDARFAMQ